jgi:hypothetical protein
LRNQPKTIGFYEPLHEALATLTRDAIEDRHAGAWASRHPGQSKPYFAEYAALLRRNGHGVAGADNRFGFDHYILEEDEADAGLRRYIQLLCDHAARQGMRPIFKCVRSQARMSWFRQTFPGYRHIAVVRHPYAQFTSAWHCLAQHNPYFVATPFLVLERNAAHPAVVALTSALDIPVEPPGFAPIGWRLRRWVRHAATMPVETLYRGAFALWLLNARQALTAPELYDGDEPASLAAALQISKGIRPPPVSGRPLISAASLRAIHAAGLDSVAPWLGAAGSQVPGWLRRAEAAADAACRHAAQDLYQPTLAPLRAR